MSHFPISQFPLPNLSPALDVLQVPTPSANKSTPHIVRGQGQDLGRDKSRTGTSQVEGLADGPRRRRRLGLHWPRHGINLDQLGDTRGFADGEVVDHNTLIAGLGWTAIFALLRLRVLLVCFVLVWGEEAA
ncbi:hypothetical protein BDV34DRAFT_201914 [Aspergillus parasiticus]|uniref:Uncharacterized protein n=1 Tax=Aspergillus parasiticus TaxID=5067 RepID=A0A5N6D9J8_ASPPA|nr:hypothetical protein BDV34DRAFT_201914 [Aspergillus parasiticus]